MCHGDLLVNTIKAVEILYNTGGYVVSVNLIVNLLVVNVLLLLKTARSIKEMVTKFPMFLA
jgi:hypothetical protein